TGPGAALSLRRIEGLSSTDTKGFDRSDSLGISSTGNKRRNIVPVPNLVKKSRGRKVPVDEGAVVSGGIKKATGNRRYVCTATGCGKCFVRGEHLKRHVRSLHTWDKPHKCPHPGCNKSFSRRDNLGQHVRVHL
ncbi:hypothetical protein BDP27DRAFT_1290614, partial [Rhodocollybia butyracea]